MTGSGFGKKGGEQRRHSVDNREEECRSPSANQRVSEPQDGVNPVVQSDVEEIYQAETVNQRKQAAAKGGPMTCQ